MTIAPLLAEGRRRTLNLLIAIDQLAWVVLTAGNGAPDETISAALYRMEMQGKWAGRIFRPIVDFVLRPLERNHCLMAWQAEYDGRQLPPSYRTNQPLHQGPT